MSAELTIESLGKDLVEMKTMLASFAATHDDKNHKEMEAKKAEDEKKEEEKMEAKKAKYSAALKAAMDEDNHEKKMAMVTAAEEEYNDKKHEAFGKPDDEHKAEEEKKEHEAQIASIINDKKQSMINQILTANRIINPQGLAEIEARLKVASITDVQKEFDIVTPFIAGVQTTAPLQQEKIVPFFANITPSDIDANQLSASSPDSDFTKLSTKDLLEGGN